MQHASKEVIANIIYLWVKGDRTMPQISKLIKIPEGDCWKIIVDHYQYIKPGLNTYTVTFESESLLRLKRINQKQENK